MFHPEAVFERTRVETTVNEQVFRTSGRRLVEAGWRAVYGELAEQDRGDDDSGGDQLLPRLEQGEGVQTRDVEWMRKETQPPRRFSDASLLGAMETAGKEVEDAELREAMKDSGIGTPATRASIIERLVDVGYIERDGRALVATEKGIQVIRLLGEHQLTSPELTGSWERRLRLIEQSQDTRPAFMDDIKKFTTDTVQELDKLKGVQIERAKLGPCPICGREITENRKGYSCWSRDDPGCGFVIWKKKAGKSLPVSVAKELIESLRAVEGARRGPRRRAHREARHRLPLARRPHVPREAAAGADRRGQVARRVRRGLGEGAPRRRVRGGARRGGREGRGARRRRRSGGGSGRRGGAGRRRRPAEPEAAAGGLSPGRNSTRAPDRRLPPWVRVSRRADFATTKRPTPGDAPSGRPRCTEVGTKVDSARAAAGLGPPLDAAVRRNPSATGFRPHLLSVTYRE